MKEKRINQKMNRVESAVSCFKEGFSCSQAVFSAYSQLFGLNREISLKLAQAFGGGMAQMGETCGAVTGAFLLIGLKHGRTRAEDEKAKEKTYELVRRFVAAFKRLHGSIRCKELLGYDISTPEGMKKAKENKLFETICPKFVQTAAEIIEEILL